MGSDVIDLVSHDVLLHNSLRGEFHLLLLCSQERLSVHIGLLVQIDS